jgi:cytochrome c oxidase subunit IV
MSHAAHEHVSNTKRIWLVFIILSAITIFEVGMGLYKPEFLHMNDLFNLNLLNWMFILLTLVKAYYIVWAFMHMEGETPSLRWSVVGSLIFLALYLIMIVLIEGHYIFGIFANSTIKWNF